MLSTTVDAVFVAIVDWLSVTSRAVRSYITTGTRVSGIGGAGDTGVAVASLGFVVVGVVVGVGDVVVVGVELVRQRVLGQHVAFLAGVDDLAFAEEASEEAALATAEARGVVVLGAGAEALFLLVVAREGEFHEDGKGKEDAGA